MLLDEASWSEGEESLSGLSEEEVLPLDTEEVTTLPPPLLLSYHILVIVLRQWD